MTGLTRPAATVLADEDFDVKPGENESFGKRGASQLDLQEMELEQPSDPDKGSQVASPDLEEETRERRRRIPRRGYRRRCQIPRWRHGRRHWIPVGDMGSAIGSQRRNTGGAIGCRRGDPGGTIKSRQKDIGGAVEFRGGNKGCSRACSWVPNNVLGHMESTDARRRERSSATKFSADDRGRRRKELVDLHRRGLNDFAEGDIGADSEGHVTGAVNRQQAMNALEKWRVEKSSEIEEMQGGRPNDKHVVGARVIYKRNMKDGEVEKYRCRLVA